MIRGRIGVPALLLCLACSGASDHAGSAADTQSSPADDTTLEARILELVRADSTLRDTHSRLD